MLVCQVCSCTPHCIDYTMKNWVALTTMVVLDGAICHDNSASSLNRFVQELKSMRSRRCSLHMARKSYDHWRGTPSTKQKCAVHITPREFARTFNLPILKPSDVAAPTLLVFYCGRLRHLQLPRPFDPRRHTCISPY